VDVDGAFEVAHVESVEVVVFVCLQSNSFKHSFLQWVGLGWSEEIKEKTYHCEVEGFHGIPCNSVTPQLI
jgi:hypothetical protein